MCGRRWFMEENERLQETQLQLRLDRVSDIFHHGCHCSMYVHQPMINLSDFIQSNAWVELRTGLRYTPKEDFNLYFIYIP